MSWEEIAKGKGLNPDHAMRAAKFYGVSPEWFAYVCEVRLVDLKNGELTFIGEWGE